MTPEEILKIARTAAAIADYTADDVFEDSEDRYNTIAEAAIDIEKDITDWHDFDWILATEAAAEWITHNEAKNNGDAPAALGDDETLLAYVRSRSVQQVTPIITPSLPVVVVYGNQQTGTLVVIGPFDNPQDACDWIAPEARKQRADDPEDLAEIDRWLSSGDDVLTLRSGDITYEIASVSKP